MTLICRRAWGALAVNLIYTFRGTKTPGTLLVEEAQAFLFWVGFGQPSEGSSLRSRLIFMSCDGSCSLPPISRNHSGLSWPLILGLNVTEAFEIDRAAALLSGRAG